MKKVCGVCHLEKELNEFRKDSKYKDGRGCQCRECKKKVEKDWREKNRKKRRKKQRDYYKKNRIKISKNRRLNYDPIKGKARWLAKIIKSGKCLFCDLTGERHHKDYSHQLDIVFLCKSHHKQVHDGTIKV